MTAAEILDLLVETFGDETITGSNLDAIDPWVEVAPQAIAEVAAFLKQDGRLVMDHLNCLSGVDYFEPNEKKAGKFGHEPHVEVVYHLSSYTHHHKITVKVILPRWKDDTAGELPEVPTVTGVWRIADWHERETFDLMGIHFTGHPNLTRILCAEDWVGHALRKDYEFPSEYHGIRGQ
jgi:NADH-quinone oxidoreductase subunit C